MAKQPATLAQAKQMDERTARQTYNLSTYGTNQPNVEDVKKNADLTRQQNLYQSSVAQGATPEEARAAAQSLGVGSATPRLDKMAYDESQRQDKLGGTPNSDLGRFKTYGDKSTFETQQALRSLRGEAPLANNAQEFQKQLAKSSSFNEKSALQTEGGQARALQSGMAAGLSQADTQSMIDEANKNILQGMKEKATFAAKDKQQAQAITAGLMGSGAYNANSMANPFTPKATAASAINATTTPSTTPLAKSFTYTPTTQIEETQQSSIPNVAGAANVMGKAVTTGVAKVGEAATKATEQAAKAAIPRLGSGTMTAAEEAAAVLNQARDVAKANLAMKEAGILSKLAGPASAIGKYAGMAGSIASKANLAKEIYQGGRVAFDEKYRNQAIDEMNKYGEEGAKAFGSEGTLGDKAAYVGNSLLRGGDVAKTLLTLGAMQTENRETQNRIAESEKNWSNAQKLQDVRLAARRAKISDEDFAKLPTKERVAISKQIGFSK
jgi:hypothetical protein